tara:strand:+ start:1691 stop:2155 length:465 start_codon:yes stop_codon:yes gene_type:complete
LQLNTYTSIEDMPIYVWWQINKTGDVTLILKDKLKHTDKVISYCSDMWDAIRDEHIEVFGMSHAFEDYMRQLAKVGIKKANFAISQNGLDKTWLKIQERELKDMESVKKHNDYKTKLILERALGITINPKTYTVMEYYTAIQVAQENATHGRGN